MGFNQVGVGLLLLYTAGLSAAQWQSLENVQVPAGLQANGPWHPSLQVNAGLPSQWTPGGFQAGSPAVAPLGPGLQFQNPSAAAAPLGPGLQLQNPSAAVAPLGPGLQLQNPSAAAAPLGPGLQLQNPSAAAAQQVIQQPVKQLTWRFPAPPQIPTPPTPVHFVRQPRPALSDGVMARCSENAVHVEVRKDLLGTDLALNVAAFTLGGCAAKGVDASSQFLIYESALHDCNSKLTMTANELVYVFTLGFAPVLQSGSPLLRSAGAQVLIECHYPRLHNVSSRDLMPAWLSHTSAQAAEELIVFSLKIMMDDWLFQRPSNQYYLGELINIEASVLQFHHVPLRVLVDSCVATPVPDMNAAPRYYFIENHGCLTDAKLTQSSSRFLPYTQAAKLRFQLEAFRFQQGNSSLVYIACKLKVTAASAPADAEHKACSFSENRWAAAYGADQVCSCCNSKCGSMRKGRDLSSKPGLQLEKEVRLDPIMVLDKVQ